MGDEVWHEPFMGLYGALAPLRLPGVDRFDDDPDARPPIHYLTGLRPTEWGLGTCTFQMPATGWLDVGTGTFAGSSMLLVADAPLTGAVITGLPPGRFATTSELSMSFLRAPQVRSGVFTARATTVNVNRRAGAASVNVTDARGRLVAHGTTRCLIVEAPGVLDGGLDGAAAAGVRGTGTGTPPYLREPVGHVLTPDEFDALSGRDLMLRYLDGTLAPAPIHNLVGGHVTRVDETSTTWAYPNSDWLLSPGPTLYGGAIAGYADAALIGAYTLAMEAGQVAAPLDVKVQFLRPVPPGTGDLTGWSEIVHRGRNLIVARSEVLDAAGKRVAVATGSALVVHGGVRRLLEDDPEALVRDAEATAEA